MNACTFEDVETLARTLWGEARGEGTAGMEAVASVILNRSRDKRWPDSIKDVCTQRYQFSAWNKNDPNRDKLLAVDLNSPSFRSAYAVAARAIAGDIHDDSCGANHYMTDALFNSSRRPSWADENAITARIGNHVFMKL